jgi:hypothetical protein
MGISTWFARKGAVGDAARWTAANFISIRSSFPDVPNFIITGVMANARYEGSPFKLKRMEAALTSPKTGNFEDLGIGHLALVFFAVDNGLPMSAIPLRYERAVIEEMGRMGIPDTVIFGSGKQIPMAEVKSKLAEVERNLRGEAEGKPKPNYRTEFDDLT